MHLVTVTQHQRVGGAVGEVLQAQGLAAQANIHPLQLRVRLGLHQRQSLAQLHTETQVHLSLNLAPNRDHKDYKGRGAHDSHLDFHTVPELLQMLLYVHRDRKDY